MFSALAKKINNASKIAIFNHEHPDGDALGSAFALKLALQSLGKQAEVFLRDGDTDTKEYKVLEGTGICGISISECDLKISLDCAEISRMGCLEAEFTGNTACIDHHKTHVPFSDTEIVIPEAAATGEIIYALIRDMNIELTPGIAQNLYVAITCDTGSFKYSSVTPKTHRIAAELLETGIDTAELSKRLFDSKSIEYLHIYKTGIDKLELYCDGRVAMLALTDDDFKDAGIDESQADAVVGLPRSIDGVEIGVYIRQRGTDEYKVSLRSNTDADVSAIAAHFGGGGHAKASGFSLKMPLDSAKKETVKTIEKYLTR